MRAGRGSVCVEYDHMLARERRREAMTRPKIKLTSTVLVDNGSSQRPSHSNLWSVSTHSGPGPAHIRRQPLASRHLRSSRTIMPFPPTISIKMRISRTQHASPRPNRISRDDSGRFDSLQMRISAAQSGRTLLVCTFGENVLENAQPEPKEPTDGRLRRFEADSSSLDLGKQSEHGLPCVH